MMECFIAYRPGDDVQELKETLEAWEIEGIEPVAIEVKPGKYEIERRVLAETLSRDSYIISELGFGPIEPNFAAVANQHLHDRPATGLIGPAFQRNGMDVNAWAVAVCRKGIVDKWPAPIDPMSYVAQHAEAYKLKGYKSFLCSEIHYRRLRASLPC